MSRLHQKDKVSMTHIIIMIVIIIGHGPFSHLFEKDVVKPLKSEFSSLKNFPKVTSKLNFVVVHYNVK